MSKNEWVVVIDEIDPSLVSDDEALSEALKRLKKQFGNDFNFDDEEFPDTEPSNLEAKIPDFYPNDL